MKLHVLQGTPPGALLGLLLGMKLLLHRWR
jgi:hypothetical protein